MASLSRWVASQQLEFYAVFSNSRRPMKMETLDHVERRDETGNCQHRF